MKWYGCNSVISTLQLLKCKTGANGILNKITQLIFRYNSDF